VRWSAPSPCRCATVPSPARGEGEEGMVIVAARVGLVFERLAQLEERTKGTASACMRVSVPVRFEGAAALEIDVGYWRSS